MPILAHFFHPSHENSSQRSRSMRLSLSSFWAKRVISRRSAVCSSFHEKSKFSRSPRTQSPVLLVFSRHSLEALRPAASEADSSRHSYDGGVVGHIGQHQTVRNNHHVVADFAVSE